MTIDIRQLTLNCRAPRELARDSTRARAFLDRVLEAVQRGLAPELSRAFASSETDERIVFLDSLEFDIAVNLDRPPEEIATRLASQLAREVWEKLSDPDVVSFRDSTELWARFLLDLTNGAAFAHTWHEQFAGLKALSTSAILRTLIETEPHAAMAALCRLTHSDLCRVINQLSAHDARRALDAITRAPTPACRDPEAIASALVILSDLRVTDSKSQLALAAVIERETGAWTDAITLQIAEWLWQMAGEATAAGSDATLTRYLKSANAQQSSLFDERWQHFVKKNATQVTSALDKLRGIPRPLQTPLFELRFGGFWLLLPWVLEQLAADDLTPGTTELAYAATAIASGEHCMAIWRSASLRATLRISQRYEELLDAILQRAAPTTAHPDARLAKGARPQPTPIWDSSVTPRPFVTRRADIVDLRSAGEHLGLPNTITRRLASIAYRALRAYARRLPGFASSSNDHLRKNFLATPGTVTSEGGLIQVLLDSPPLNVIWRISGAGRAHYSLPGGPPITVDVRK